MMTTQTIDMTPTFEDATRMCIRLLEQGDIDGKRTAREELLRYARELDRLKAAAGTSFDPDGTAVEEDA